MVMAVVGGVLVPATAVDREVRISWGDDWSASDREDCPEGANCRNLSYELTGFGAGPYQLECWSESGGRSWSGAWSGQPETGCYAWDGATVWVVIDGVKSNTITWLGPERAWGSTVSVGTSHSCGVRPDGSIVCWGFSGHGRTDAPQGDFVSVSARGSHSCGVRADGSVVCWGYDQAGETDAPQGDFVSVSAGGGHSCAVRGDGSVVCWGFNGNGETDAPQGDFVSVSAGGSHSCGLRADGSVVCWGADADGRTGAPGGRFVSVSAGAYAHSCGLRADGSVVCWGFNGNGETDAPQGEFVSVSAGYAHSCAVRRDGSVSCWGRNFAGAADAPEGEFVSVSVGYERSCALRRDGSVACWGKDKGSSGKFALPVAGRPDPIGGEEPVNVPGPPSGVSVEVGTIGAKKSVVVSWKPPGSDGGSAVTGYVVEYSRPGKTFKRSKAASVRSDSVSARSGAAYTVTVAAKNKNGVGKSVVKTVTVPGKGSGSLPGAPSGATVEVKTVGGKKSVVVSWKPPGSDGGSAVTGYVVEYSRPGKTFKRSKGPSVQSDSLTARSGTTYTVSVAARNKNGVGKSVVKTVTVPKGTGSGKVTTPGPPRNVSVRVGESKGKNSVLVSWDPPENDGGSPVAGYSVKYSRPGKTFTRKLSSSTHSDSVSAKSGVEYTVTVWAKNRKGSGESVERTVDVRWSCPSGTKFDIDDGLFTDPIFATRSFRAGGELVRVGDEGGRLDNEGNLSQEGCSWVFYGAGVIHSGFVGGNAVVKGKGTQVRDSARVLGNAVVSGGARIVGTAVIKGNVRIDGPVTIDSGEWNGWKEFVRPLKETHDKLFDELYKRLRNCVNTRAESDDKVAGYVRDIINLNGSSRVDEEGPTEGNRNVAVHVLLSCDILRAQFGGILKAIVPGWDSLIEVLTIGKLYTAGKTLLGLKSAIEDFTDSIDEDGSREEMLEGMRDVYKNLYDNVCRNESDCRSALRRLRAAEDWG